MFGERIPSERGLTDGDGALNGRATLQLTQVFLVQLKFPPDVADFWTLVVTRYANLGKKMD